MMFSVQTAAAKIVFLLGFSQPSVSSCMETITFWGHLSLFITSKAGLCAVPVCIQQTESFLLRVLPYTIYSNITGEQTIWKHHTSPVISLLHLSTVLAWYLLVTESPHQCKQFPVFAAALKPPNSQMLAFPTIANPAPFFPHFGTQCWTNLLSKEVKSALLSPCLRASHF